MGNIWRKMRPLHDTGVSADTLDKPTEGTYHPNEDYPRPKYEHREDSRDEGHGRLLRRTKSVFDGGLGVVVDFLWVWDDGL